MKRNTSAFSLVEILIVLAVVAIIVAIGFPALRNSRENSEKQTALGNAKTLNDARERAILKNVGGISSMEDWTNSFGTNGATATAFLIENGLVRPPSP